MWLTRSAWSELWRFGTSPHLLLGLFFPLCFVSDDGNEMLCGLCVAEVEPCLLCIWLQRIASKGAGMRVKQRQQLAGFTALMTFLVLQICKDIHTPCGLNRPLNFMSTRWWECLIQPLEEHLNDVDALWCLWCYYGEVASCCLNLKLTCLNQVVLLSTLEFEL